MVERHYLLREETQSFYKYNPNYSLLYKIHHGDSESEGPENVMWATDSAMQSARRGCAL